MLPNHFPNGSIKLLFSNFMSYLKKNNWRFAWCFGFWELTLKNNFISFSALHLSNRQVSTDLVPCPTSKFFPRLFPGTSLGKGVCFNVEDLQPVCLPSPFSLYTAHYSKQCRLAMCEGNICKMTNLQGQNVEQSNSKQRTSSNDHLYNCCQIDRIVFSCWHWPLALANLRCSLPVTNTRLTYYNLGGARCNSHQHPNEGDFKMEKGFL